MMFWIILLFVILLLCGPLAVIWSLNTLFGLGIAYTWSTWLAAAVLFSGVIWSRSK